MALLEIENMSFSYALGEAKALDNISLTVERGEFVLLMGKSASGKSTLLKLIKSELSPAGNLIGKINCNTEKTGFVLQNTDSSFVSDKVRGELAFPLENKCIENDEIAIKIGELAAFLNISHKLDNTIEAMSGGERASVAIASAILGGSELLLLDEPFAQLDPKATEEVVSMLKRLNQELGVTIILSSHSSAEIIDICDRLIVLDKGKILSDDTIVNSVKKSELLPFFPTFTRLFDERPLTVKQARRYAHSLRQNPSHSSSKAEKSVEIKHLTFAYGRKERDILASLSYTAYKGAINCIIGANASGKTTLIKAIAGIKKQYSGKIRLSGSVCYMPQNVRHMFTKDHVGEEISESTAKKLGILSLLDRHPYDLSGGQAQLVALGILLEQNADILLLDEPTRALDCFAKEELSHVLKELADSGKTIVIVTHDLEFAGEHADYVSFLSDGIIAMTGGTKEVFSSLDFYTTQVRRITKHYLDNAVSMGDIES